MLKYQYIKVRNFDHICLDMEKRIRAKYTGDNKDWKTATMIARELLFDDITQRETVAICKILRSMRIKTRRRNGFWQFLV